MASEFAEEGMSQTLKNPFGQPMVRPKKAAQTAAAIQRAWKMRQAARAGSGATKLAKVSSTLSKIAKVATLGGGPVGTLTSIAAWTIIPKILEGLISGGGGEQPPMEQAPQTSQDPTAAMLGGGDMGGQAAGSSDMSDLLAENDSVRKMRRLGTTSNNLTRSLQSRSAGPELMNLIGVDEARVRSLQTPRTLSPYEVMNLIG